MREGCKDRGEKRGEDREKRGEGRREIGLGDRRGGERELEHTKLTLGNVDSNYCCCIRS